jgi:hypothetical protein
LECITIFGWTTSGTKPQKWAKSAKLLVVLLIMLDTLRRMFHDVRPIDWIMLVVEVLVLLLIAYEIGHGMWRKFILRRRTKLVLKFLWDGLALKHDACTVTEDAVGTWKESVEAWTQATITGLQNHSIAAGLSFVHTPTRPAGSYGGVTRGANDTYGVLVARIDTLREIMEKADVYF